MFAVKPITDKSLQLEICRRVGAEYDEASMAYFAAEIDSDLSSVTELIGVCQFTLGDTAVMTTLMPSPGRENDEAMIIMCRTAMNFMWRSGASEMLLCENAGPSSLLECCGLLPCVGGYHVNLDEFYKSPCAYRAAHTDKSENKNN